MYDVDLRATLHTLPLLMTINIVITNGCIWYTWVIFGATNLCLVVVTLFSMTITDVGTTLLSMKMEEVLKVSLKIQLHCLVYFVTTALEIQSN